MSDLFGWDLIYRVSERDLKKKEDVLALFIHYCLIRGGYRCIGLGDEKVLSGNEKSSEVLPQGWNESSNFSLRYVLNGNLFILRGLPVDSALVFNFLDASTLTVTNVAFVPSATVSCCSGPIHAILPNYEDILNRVQKELLDPHTKSSADTKETSTQTARGSRANDPPPAGVPLPPGGIPCRPAFPPDVTTPWDPDRDPLRSGARDLNPFGQGVGGGMIFDPFDRRNPLRDPGAGTPGGLPRGSVPPGARFDPFGPPDLPGPGRGRFPPGGPPGGGSFGLGGDFYGGGGII